MDFDFSPIVENWRFFAGGLGITVALSAITAVSSILLGLVIALLRLYGPRWRRARARSTCASRPPATTPAWPTASA